MYLDEILIAQHRGEAQGIPSVCSAHPDVLRESMRLAPLYGMPALIETTCNQVNQFGGYTGFTPSRFAASIRALAAQCELPPEDLILGGDHLGPSVWQNESSHAAMHKARELVREYVQAGFTKIHLDCSMRLADDPPLGPGAELVAERAAELAAVAEDCNHEDLRFVIGSEVPVPGGALYAEELAKVSAVETVSTSVVIHRRAFHRRGLQAAWDRVVAVVVQPGVEFGDDFVLEYEPRKADALRRFIETQSIVYEAHSTDYQTSQSLRWLVRDHFAILKVGPALTFAYREAVFELASIENELFPAGERSHLIEIMDQAMLQHPQYWQKYYAGSEDELSQKRRFSQSDRIRYYWTKPEVQAALQHMTRNLTQRPIPPSLALQYASKEAQALQVRGLAITPAAVISEHVAGRLQTYFDACRPNDRPA